MSHSLWVEKYRPHNLETYIGNEHLKDKVKIYLESGDVPHLLLYGTAGTGNAAEGVEYKIGATRSTADNDLTSTAIIVMLESNVAGTVLNKLVGAALTGSSTIVELTTSALANSVGAGEKTDWRAAHEDAPDARNAEDTVAGGASTAVTKTRVAWL